MKTLLRELKSTLQSHDKLNPKYWTDEKLDPEVWQALNKISKEWAKFANIPSRAIKDIILVGGNANYNYTRFSDLDLHLVVDKSKIADCPELLDDYLRDKKSRKKEKYNPRHCVLLFVWVLAIVKSLLHDLVGSVKNYFTTG